MALCRVCETPRKPFMSFGQQPIANGFLREDNFADEYFYEMAVAVCPNCHMFQLEEQPAPETMFHGEYAFFSQSSKGMQVHFERFAKSLLDEYPLSAKPFIVELGSNDGIMLKHLKSQGVQHLGIEPSENVAKVASDAGINTWNVFFNSETAEKILAAYGPADVVCAANVMCHIPDFKSLAKGIHQVLKPEGLLIFEDPYLGDVINKTSFDQIYDEHVFIFSAHSVQAAFKLFDLELIDVQAQVVHGGELRYVLGKTGAHQVHERVTQQLAWEQTLGLNQAETYQKFKQSCEFKRDALKQVLIDLKSNQKKIAGYAATSKSTTILNYAQIGPDLLDYICDTTPIKHHTYSPGMHIPVKPYEDFKNQYPDYAVQFAWNHAAEIAAKEQFFIQQGGRWINFIPEVQIQ